MSMLLAHFVVSVIKASLVMGQKHVMVCTANSCYFSLQNHVIEMQYVILQDSFISRVLGHRDGLVVITALFSHQCGPGLNPTTATWLS